MIYDTTTCNAIIKRCNEFNKIFYFEDCVDKTKIRHYTDLNNISCEKVKRCIELAFEYQKENKINGECITNAILLYDILRAFGHDNYYPRMTLSVGSFGEEYYTPHMIVYNRDTDTILDMSWGNYWEVTERDFYYSFAVNKILKEAVDKKIITGEKRFERYEHYCALNECSNETITGLDYGKRRYYNELLKYIKENTEYVELEKINPQLRLGDIWWLWDEDDDEEYEEYDFPLGHP